MIGWSSVVRPKRGYRLRIWTREKWFVYHYQYWLSDLFYSKIRNLDTVDEMTRVPLCTFNFFRHSGTQIFSSLGSVFILTSDHVYLCDFTSIFLLVKLWAPTVPYLCTVTSEVLCSDFFFWTNGYSPNWDPLRRHRVLFRGTSSLSSFVEDWKRSPRSKIWTWIFLGKDFPFQSFTVFSPLK